jgi:hypothetical protein
MIGRGLVVELEGRTARDYRPVNPSAKMGIAARPESSALRPRGWGMPRPKRTQSERDAATIALVQATRDKPRPTIEQLREAVEKADQEGVTTLRFEFARSASSKAKTWLLAGPGLSLIHI